MLVDVDHMLVLAIQKFYVEHKFIDLKMVRHGRELFFAHKIVLAAGSTYFDKLLQPASDCVVLSLDAIEDRVIEHLDSIIRYAYGYSIVVPFEKLESFQEAAHLFGVTSLCKLLQSKHPKPNVVRVTPGQKPPTFKAMAFGSLLLVMFQRYRKFGKMLDVQIAGKQGRFPALYGHKLVLCAFSSYFENLLEGTQGYVVVDLSLLPNCMESESTTDKAISTHVDELDWLFGVMYGRQKIENEQGHGRKNVVDVDVLKNLVKILGIKLSWSKIESCVFGKRKKNKKRPISLNSQRNGDINLEDLEAAVRVDRVDELACSSSSFHRDQMTDERFRLKTARKRNPDLKEKVNFVQNNADSDTAEPPGPSNALNCNFCGLLFGTFWDLYYHLSVKHGKNDFTCHKCGAGIFNFPDFLAHWNTHSSTSRPNFKCPACTFTCQSKDALSEHISTTVHRSTSTIPLKNHLLVRQRRLPTKTNEKTSKFSHKQRQRHLSTTSLDDETPTSNFRRQRLLPAVSFIKDVNPRMTSDLHAPQQKRPLSTAPYQSGAKASKIAAQDCIPHVISLNSRNSSQQRRLPTESSSSADATLTRRRKRRLSTEKSIACEECGATCSTVGALNKHARLAHRPLSATNPLVYACCACDHVTDKKSSLGLHVRTMHMNIRPFQCQLCSYAAVTKSHLKRHEMVHTGETPFKCRYCPRSFPERRSLNAHIGREHKKRAPFACPICSSSFFRNDHMLSHVRIVHKVEFKNLDEFDAKKRQALTTFKR